MTTIRRWAKPSLWMLFSMRKFLTVFIKEIFVFLFFFYLTKRHFYFFYVSLSTTIFNFRSRVTQSIINLSIYLLSSNQLRKVNKSQILINWENCLCKLVYDNGSMILRSPKWSNQLLNVYAICSCIIYN